jgi:hypothetical protein
MTVSSIYVLTLQFDDESHMIGYYSMESARKAAYTFRLITWGSPVEVKGKDNFRYYFDEIPIGENLYYMAEKQ